MTNNLVPRSDLIDFFNLKERGLPCVLRELNLRPIGGHLTWPVVWKALGLAAKQDPEHHCELKKPLMTAAEVGVFCGVSARTIYRWQEGIGLPADRGPMPRAIDLSAGRKDARKTRWRESEIRAWQDRELPPAYALVAPTFGALKPTP